MRNERESCEETEDTGFCAAREWESKVTSATPRSFFLLTENSSHQTANHLMLAIVFPSGNVSVMSFLRYRFNVSDLSQKSNNSFSFLSKEFWNPSKREKQVNELWIVYYENGASLLRINWINDEIVSSRIFPSESYF